MDSFYTPDERKQLENGDFAPFRRQFEEFGENRIYFNTSGRGALPKVSHQAAIKSVSEKKWPWLVADQDETELREEVAKLIIDSQEEGHFVHQTVAFSHKNISK